MKEQHNFDAVCKWCDERRWGSGLVESDVSSVWVLEHAEELRQKAKSDNWSKGAIQTLEEWIEEGKIVKSYQRLDTRHRKEVSAFFKEITVLKANWANYKLLCKSAAFADQFRNSRDVMVASMWESVVLQLTRLLTDGKKVCGKEVLTIDTLAEKILDGVEKNLDDNAKKKGFLAKKKSFLDRIKEVQELPVVKKMKNEWRHTRVAHCNYAAALGAAKVSSIRIDEVDKAIEMFVAVFQDLGRELGNSYN